MANLAKSAHALLWGVSAFALCMGVDTDALAQTAAQSQNDSSVANSKQASAKRTRKKPKPVAVSQDVFNANAQVAPVAYVGAQTLDTITVAASKTEERAIDALAPVSVVTQEQIQTTQPKRLGDLLQVLPGVTLQDRGDDASTAVNIRGLQDFGRVAVVVDGARQNYQRTGHNANGSFFLDPELIGGIDVVRGPTANIYGSGAIGGLVSSAPRTLKTSSAPASAGASI